MIRRVLVVAASGLLGLVLAGCGSGQDAPTTSTLSSVPGVNADDSGVGVRNARVPFAGLAGYPAGGDAPVELSVVNTGTEPVQLVDLSSPAARSVTVASVAYVDGPPGTTGNPPNGGASPQLLLAPASLANATLQASGLTGPLDATTVLPVVLTFDNGAVLELDVPAAPPAEPLPREPMDLEEEDH